MRQREIFWFWLPLFASWLLMTAEGPIISAAINRLPNEVVMLAAQGIVVSLSVMIESPIINLLATSTALVKDRSSYRLVRNFTFHWVIVLTVITIIVAYTPVFDLVVTSWLEAPGEIARWVRPGMQIMTLWSAAIAWRRFLQGVLIGFDRTRQVAWGTAVRLATTAASVFYLSLATDWAGVYVASTALMAGVVAEAAFATVAVRPLLLRELAPENGAAAGEALTYRELFWFHLPLAGTAVLILFVQPLVTLSLARLEQPTQTLAAWPVLFQLMLMSRAAALALPEVVIALSKKGDYFLALRRFSLNVTGLLALFMVLFTFSPAAGFYLYVVQDMTLSVGALAQSSLPLFVLFPSLNALVSWLRGLLIHGKATREVNLGMVVNLVITVVVLGTGLVARLPGLPTAAIALNAALVGEIIFLALRAQRVLPLKVPVLSFWRPHRQWQARSH